MKAAIDTRDEEEYKYFKEKRLLQYMRLDGRLYKEYRRQLDNKIKTLEIIHQ